MTSFRIAFVFLLFQISTLNAESQSQSERLKAVAHFNEYASVGYNDCWGYTDEEGREYALLGVRNGTSVIEITDAENLRELAFIPSRTSNWKDIKTYKHYAYAVNETGGGLQIIDLSGLPNEVKELPAWKAFSNSHNLWVDEEAGVLYIIHAEKGHSVVVRAVSLEDPENPTPLSQFGVEAHDIFVRDGMAYVSEGGHGTIGIFDVKNPRSPRLLGRFQIPRGGYVHNAWLTEDNRYLMTTEETKGKSMKIWDVSDPQNVVQVSEYLAPNGLAHNTHIKGDYAYISHYGSGLRIVDVSDPFKPIEVAYFLEGETDRPGNWWNGGFIDVWGAFPFFESGKVLISDIEDGLYVVEFPTE